MLKRGNSGDGCDLAYTLCKYDLRKGDLFGLSVWLRCAQYLLFVDRCLETIDVCIWRMFVFMSVWGCVRMFVV